MKYCDFYYLACKGVDGKWGLMILDSWYSTDPKEAVGCLNHIRKCIESGNLKIITDAELIKISYVDGVDSLEIVNPTKNTFKDLDIDWKASFENPIPYQYHGTHIAALTSISESGLPHYLAYSL